MEQTRQEFIKELKQVQEKVYQMGIRAGAALDKSMKALCNGDRAMAAEVMQEDGVIDDMIIDIEDTCLLLIAKQQPITRIGKSMRIMMCLIIKWNTPTISMSRICRSALWLHR